jgi:hypothetical protein
MPTYSTVPEPELERQGRRFGPIAGRFILIGLVLGVPGVLMFILGHAWLAAIGIALAAVAAPPAMVGIALLLTAVVARWTARHRPLA